MSVIDANYEVVDRQRANFHGGSIPSWLSAPTGGGGTATISDGDPSVRLSSGTSSSGDFARLQSGDISVDNFDATMIRATLLHNFAATSEKDASTHVGFEGPSGNDYAHHFFNINGNFLNNIVTVVSGGSKNGTVTRDALVDELVTTELLWDTVDGKLIHRVQNAFGAEVTSDIPDPSLDYKADILCQTVNTASERIVWVYSFEIVYLNKLG